MPKTKREKIPGKRWTTRYPNIYVYWTKRYGWRYQVRFNYTVNGVEDEYSESGFASQAEALAVYNEVYPRLTKGDVAFLNADEVTFKERWEQVSDIKLRSGTWKKKTYIQNKSLIKPFIDRFGTYTLSQVNNKKLIQDWIYKHYDETDAAPGTVKNIIKLAGIVINEAVDEDILDKNRIKKVVYDRPSYQSPNKKISDHDYKRFMEAASNEENMPFFYYTGIRLFAHGLRRSEAVYLKKKMIKFLPDGTAIIHLTDDLKTKSSERFIAVDKETATLLKRVIKRAEDIKKSFNSILHKEDYIFLNKKTGSVYRPQSFYRIVKILGKKLNIDIHPHMFRHTYASKALAQGVDNLMLQKVLGHASLEMTSHYAKGTEETAIAVLQRMSEA